jgi:hypothetical protein
MADFHILIWALSLLFCMAMGFVILLWCRSWRREEREATERHVENLSREISRLAVAVDGMDETAASLLAADDQLANDIERLREQVRLIRSAGGIAAGVGRPDDETPLNETPRAETPVPETPLLKTHAADGSSDPETSPEVEAVESKPSADRYEEARRLLREGLSELEVARQLEMGAAEIRMISRMLDQPTETESP